MRSHFVDVGEGRAGAFPLGSGLFVHTSCGVVVPPSSYGWLRSPDRAIFAGGSCPLRREGGVSPPRKCVYFPPVGYRRRDVFGVGRKDQVCARSVVFPRKRPQGYGPTRRGAFMREGNLLGGILKRGPL